MIWLSKLRLDSNNSVDEPTRKAPPPGNAAQLLPQGFHHCFGQMLQAGHHPAYSIYDHASRENPFIEAFIISGHAVSKGTGDQAKTIAIRNYKLWCDFLLADMKIILKTRARMKSAVTRANIPPINLASW